MGVFLPKSFIHAVWVLCVALVGGGCRSAAVDHWTSLPEWSVDDAEIVSWHSENAAFGQDFALEASGLAVSDRFLYLASEKYARVLQVELSPDHQARAMVLDAPPHSELEGLALHEGTFYLCDEAHAAVYSASLGDEDDFGTSPDHRSIETRALTVEGVRVQGSKIGFEGIEVSPDGKVLFLLLERSGTIEHGCSSKIYRSRIRSGHLELEKWPLVVKLEDCDWRLSGLAWWGDGLLALKTQFPGQRYQVIQINPKNREWRVVLDLTDFLRSVANQGWSNNVEGIAVAQDGSLWLVADNAVTGIVDDPLPPRADQKTLLLRIPPAANRMYN
jgi:hypothetical protein